MQQANQWRIRDKEEYTIALAYIYTKVLTKAPLFGVTPTIKIKPAEPYNSLMTRCR